MRRVWPVMRASIAVVENAVDHQKLTNSHDWQKLRHEGETRNKEEEEINRIAEHETQATVLCVIVLYYLC